MTRLLEVGFLLAVIAGCSGGEESAETIRETVTAAAPTAPEAEATTTEAASEPAESVRDFVLRVNRYLLDGQYGRAFEILHPNQQRVFDRNPAAFAACWASFGGETGISDVEHRVVEVFDERWPIPPETELRPSKAVTIRVVQAFSEEGSDIETELDRFTQHVFVVDDGWAWIVAPQVIDDYRQDFCG